MYYDLLIIFFETELLLADCSSLAAACYIEIWWLKTFFGWGMILPCTWPGNMHSILLCSGPRPFDMHRRTADLIALHLNTKFLRSPKPWP